MVWPRDCGIGCVSGAKALQASMYKLDTRALAVEVNHGSAARVFGEMFLRPSIITLSGVESVADRMNDRDAFFPLRVSEPEPATLLIGKAQVRYVAAPELPDAESSMAAEQASDSVHFNLDVELDDGLCLNGVFHAVLPRGKRRALDFINEQEGAFVTFHAEKRQYVINRSFIRRLRDVAR
jgi:hypothetical protein